MEIEKKNKRKTINRFGIIKNSQRLLQSIRRFRLKFSKNKYL